MGAKRRFALGVLKGIGVQPNPNNLKALLGWMAAEGGHFHNTARYNPLNTTLNLPGSGDTGSQGNISVYRNWDQGVKATVKTLENGRYGGIINALRSGAPRDVAAAIDASPWGTHGALVYQTIAAARAGAIPTGMTTNAQPAAGAAAAPQPAATMGSVFDQAGFDKAKRASLIGGLIAKRRGTDNILFRTGLLTTQAPVASDFLKPGLLPAARAAATPATGQMGNSPLTVPGTGPDEIRTLIERANKIDVKHYNYEWGGGHNAGVTPSHGIGHGSGPGIGFDCSGAVSKVLGINPKVASEFMSFGKPGRGKNVTIYAKGTHVLMEINGHFFGTSGANPGGGAGWIPKAALSSSYLSGFVARHPAGM